jgi:tRNA G18 (ribose-2'-O)-methylase SpoU
MLLDVPLNHALSDVDGALEMAGLKFVAFTHVKHHQWLTVVHHRPKVVGFAFPDVTACSLNDGEEPRAVLLGHDFCRWVSLLRASHQPASMAGQITGLEAVMEALRSGVAIDRVLVDRAHDTTELRALCEGAGIPLEEGSTNDLWRMSADGAQVALALTGRPQSESLEEVMAAGGCVWLFDGVEYSTNLGFAIRTAEVSGADAVLLNVSKTHEERRTIRRASMRADRFIPVVYTTTKAILLASKANNFRIVAAEDVGTNGPWDEDLTGDVILVVGAERDGVSPEVLAAADAVVKLPMDGFVPSYNLQVAVSVLAVEALRQRQSLGN